MKKVINEYGTKINYDAAVNLMDDGIREELNSKFAPCSEQKFFDEYCKVHAEKYGEEWELAKENPNY